MSDRIRFLLAGLLPGLLLGLMIAGLSAQEEPPPPAQDRPRDEQTGAPARSESICLLIESAASANGLPLEFFARVIWQESRFRPEAVGPLTRRGERARGIAQFMPRTAAERGLLDPFDPVAALPKSAEFLRALRDQFGNLGLAAAAYNAGPQRVRDWMAGSRTLPAETRNYVLAITGIAADDWAKGGKREPAQPAAPNCAQLTALLHRAPNPFVQKLEERVNLVAASPWAQVIRGDRGEASRRIRRRRCAHSARQVSQPRHARLLPGARRRRHARRRQRYLRPPERGRRRVFRVAQFEGESGGFVGV